LINRDTDAHTRLFYLFSVGELADISLYRLGRICETTELLSILRTCFRRIFAILFNLIDLLVADLCFASDRRSIAVRLVLVLDHISDVYEHIIIGVHVYYLILIVL
jgi:hypothetical protein